MTPLILSAVAGALIFALFVSTIVYRGQAVDAETKRDEAITLAADALVAKKNAEEGFEKAKLFFEKHMNQPLTALMTDEQCDRVANYIAGKVFLSSHIVSQAKQ